MLGEKHKEIYEGSEEKILPEDLKEGLEVTWTEEGIKRSLGDELDAALVRGGEVLIVVGKYDEKRGTVKVKKSDGTEFPANLEYLKKV